MGNYFPTFELKRWACCLIALAERRTCAPICAGSGLPQKWIAKDLVMKKFLIVAVSLTILGASVGGCASIGKGKGKGKAPAAAPYSAPIVTKG